jgi:hypothetical protein
MSGARKILARRLPWRDYVRLLLAIVLGVAVCAPFILSALASGGAG